MRLKTIANIKKITYNIGTKKERKVKNMEKITERELLKNIVDNYDGENQEQVIALAQKKIAQLDHRNEKARERNAKKAATPDELTEKILSLLTDEPQTVNELVAAIGDPKVSNPKVSTRASKLVKAGKAEKTEVAVEGKKSKLVAYLLPQE